MLNSALQGLRVIDFTQVVAGPTCTMLLSDLGADVTKIEAPGGDLCRALPPFAAGESVTFIALNRNKRSVVLDLKNPDQVASAIELVAQADVVVESFRPGVMSRRQRRSGRPRPPRAGCRPQAPRASRRSRSWSDRPAIMRRLLAP